VSTIFIVCVTAVTMPDDLLLFLMYFSIISMCPWKVLHVQLA